MENKNDNLNAAQATAANHSRGPLLIVAGAGAGKTKTVTHRIKNLVQAGVRPDQILAVTFTNKAAREMRERILHLLGVDPNTFRAGLWALAENPELPFVSTFHSLGVYMLKKHGHLIGLAVRLACQRMKGEALAGMQGLVKKLRRASDNGDRSGFLDARAELERFVGERSFSPRLAHLLEVMAYPSARYRVFHVSVPGYMEQVTHCYEGIYEAFCKRDDRQAEALRCKVMELGRELLRRYFIEPYAGLRAQERSGEQL